MSEENVEVSKGFQQCVECGSIRLTRHEENSVCLDCGFVINTNTPHRSPERDSSGKRREAKYANAYIKTLTPHNGGQNDIDRYLDDYNKLDEKFRKHLIKLWWKNARVSDATEKNLSLGFSEITKISDILSLAKIVPEKAATTYKMIVCKRSVRGRNIRTLSAAAVYMACKQCGFPQTLNEVAEASGISKRDVGKGYRFLAKELNYSIPPIEITKYLNNLLNRVTISEKTKETADKILEVIDELRLTCGRNPMSIAAAAMYTAVLLTGDGKTQREIAESSRLTEATIRSRYKELAKRLLFTVAI